MFEETLRQIVREELDRLVARLEGRDVGTRGKDVGTHAGFLSIKEAANVARVHPATIQRALRMGGLTRHGTGRRTRISRADLQAWVEGGQGARGDTTPAAVAAALLKG